jgi:hypothetical protein
VTNPIAIAPARGGWCILRTSGPRTIALAKSLSDAGIEAWTPKRTLKRPKPGRCELIDGRKPMIEIEAPIVPSFVFARYHHLTELAAIVAGYTNTQPQFSLFRHAGRYPEVADSDVRGLMAAEAEAADVIRQIREAETRQEAERIRVAALKSEQLRNSEMRRLNHERLMALTAERRAMRADFSPGTAVDVAEAPAFIGVPGTIVEGGGRTALVSFGGSLLMKIEAWRLSVSDVSDAHAHQSIAA